MDKRAICLLLPITLLAGCAKKEVQPDRRESQAGKESVTNSERQLRDKIRRSRRDRRSRARVFDYADQVAEFARQGRYLEAAERSQAAMASARSDWGEEHLIRGRMTVLFVKFQRLARDRHGYEGYGETALQILEKHLAADDPEIADALQVYGLALLDDGLDDHLALSKAKLDKCREIRESTLPPDDPAIADILLSLAEWHQFTGDVKQAEELCSRSVSILEKSGPSVRWAEALLMLGRFKLDQGEFQEAEKLFDQGLQICTDLALDGHPVAGNIFLAKGELATARRQYAAAASCFDRAIKIHTGKTGTYQEQVIQIARARALLANDDLAQVETILKHAERELGSQRRTFDASLTSADYLIRVHQYGEAHQLLQQLAESVADDFGLQHPRLAQCYDRLGRCALGLHQYGFAESLFQNSLKIKQVRFAPQDVRLTGTLEGLASVRAAAGDFDESIRLLRESEKIKQQVFGPDSIDVAETKLMLAEQLLAQKGSLDAAKTELMTALDVLTAKEPNGSNLQLCGYHLVAIHMREGKRQEAIDLMDQVLRATRNYVRQRLPLLGQDEQIRFINGVSQRYLARGASVALALNDDEATAARSYEWQLNFKGLLLESIAGMTARARESKSKEVRALRERISTLRSDIGRIGREGILLREGYRPNFSHVRLCTQMLNEVSHELGRLLQEETESAGWRRAAGVRLKQDSDSVYIDFVRVPIERYSMEQAGAQTPHYLAWIVPAGGDKKIRLVDLGEARAIENAIRDFRTTNLRSILAENSVEASVKEVRRSLGRVSELVLRPLEPHIRESTSWVISPDVGLWLLPFSALLTEDGSYVVEKHAINYVPSGRELLKPKQSHPSSQPLVLAAPDYDARSEGERTPWAVFDPLPGTAEEARLIAPHLKRLAKQEPWIVTGGDARERLAKSANNPRVLVLSTHGFFGGPWVNPLLNCGLALAGANTDGDWPDDDGLLTGLEIIDIDLRGTRLAVLSACQTGLGELAPGEGVAGLQQAFLLAGADAVVASLWPIPDMETATLMSEMFDELADGKDNAEALREAQLAQIRSKDNDGKTAHPFYWAAFTLTGQRSSPPSDGSPDVQLPHAIVRDIRFDMDLEHYGRPCFSPDSKLAFTTYHAELRRWDTASGQELQMHQLRWRMRDLKVTADLQSMFCLKDTSVGGDLFQVDLTGAGPGRQLNKELLTGSGNDSRNYLTSFVMTSDEKLLLTSDPNSRLRVWDIEKRAFTRELQSVGATVMHLSFLPDEKHVQGTSVTGLGSRDFQRSAIHIWDFHTGKLVTSHKVEGPGIFLPDMKRAVSAAGDVIQLWDVAANRKIREFHGHGGRILDLITTRDSKLLISSSTDQTVRVWDISSGWQVQIIRDRFSRRDPYRNWHYLTLSPDERFLLGGLFLREISTQ